MRLRDKRFGIVLLLCALAGCDESSGSPTNEAPELADGEDPASDDVEDSGDDGDTADAAPHRRDAGRTDASARDAGLAEAPTSELTPDGGRRRRDGGSGSSSSDAATPDAAAPAASDAAVPTSDHCGPTANWDPQWAAYEDEVLRLTNEARAAGASCGSMGTFPAAAPLTMEARLRCSARLYSEEMVRTGAFGHTSVDGTKFNERIANAGYRGRLVGENIAAGYSTPAEVVRGWMKSEGHCKNIMTPGFSQIGVGYYVRSGALPHWTQNFGTPQ